jgi:hypothetical protein
MRMNKKPQTLADAVAILEAALAKQQQAETPSYGNGFELIEAAMARAISADALKGAGYTRVAGRSDIGGAR